MTNSTIDEDSTIGNSARVEDPSAARWRFLLGALFVIGVLVAVGLPAITGSITSAGLGVQILLFGLLIAAIRSLRH